MVSDGMPCGAGRVQRRCAACGMVRGAASRWREQVNFNQQPTRQQEVKINKLTERHPALELKTKLKLARAVERWWREAR